MKHFKSEVPPWVSIFFITVATIIIIIIIIIIASFKSV